MELPVVNHKDYVAKIDDDHKFPIKKFGELANYLIEKKVVSKFYEPFHRHPWLVCADRPFSQMPCHRL